MLNNKTQLYTKYGLNSNLKFKLKTELTYTSFESKLYLQKQDKNNAKVIEWDGFFFFYCYTHTDYTSKQAIDDVIAIYGR